MLHRLPVPLCPYAICGLCLKMDTASTHTQTDLKCFGAERF